jgi:heterodisulfide reductase subunit A-like polyferredoxin
MRIRYFENINENKALISVYWGFVETNKVDKYSLGKYKNVTTSMKMTTLLLTIPPQM